MTWQANWVKSLPKFSSAIHILEVGAGSFATSLKLAREFPDKQIIAVDFELSEAALRNLVDIPRNLSVVKHDARDFSLFSDGYFDFIFSVAVMEHIAELETHLSESFRIIKDSGMYCFWQAPFWSCSMGHHYKHWLPNCPIPPYGHLYLSRKELGELLSSQIADESEVAYILNRVYERLDLSRLTRSQTIKIVKESRFALTDWDDDIDENYNEDLAARVANNNIYRVDVGDLMYKGARVCLEKMPTSV